MARKCITSTSVSVRCKCVNGLCMSWLTSILWRRGTCSRKHSSSMAPMHICTSISVLWGPLIWQESASHLLRSLRGASRCPVNGLCMSWLTTILWRGGTCGRKHSSFMAPMHICTSISVLWRCYLGILQASSKNCREAIGSLHKASENISTGKLVRGWNSISIRSAMKIFKVAEVHCYGPLTNVVSREGEGGGYPSSDAVREVVWF